MLHVIGLEFQNMDLVRTLADSVYDFWDNFYSYFQDFYRTDFSKAHIFIADYRIIPRKAMTNIMLLSIFQEVFIICPTTAIYDPLSSHLKMFKIDVCGYIFPKLSNPTPHIDFINDYTRNCVPIPDGCFNTKYIIDDILGCGVKMIIATKFK